MTDYVKSTAFASKDALLTGNPLKIVKGTEIDTEFNNLQTVSITKADLLSPAFTGIPTAATAAVNTNTTQLATTAFVAAATTGSFVNVTASGTVTATGVITGSVLNDSLGNARNIPLQSKTATYTLVAADNGQCITTNSAVTIPAGVFAANNVVTIYNNSVATIAITQGSGLTLQFAGQATSTTGNRTLALYSITTVLFLSASSAVITGAGLY